MYTPPLIITIITVTVTVTQEFYIHCSDESEACASVRWFLAVDEEEGRLARRIAVVGPVYLLFDQWGVPLKQRAAQPIVVVSTPPLNFAAQDSPDRQHYIVNGSIPAEHTNAVLERMRHIWHHVFSLMQREHVGIALVPALGCGTADSGGVSDVPILCARALRQVLQTQAYHLEAVVVCVPVASHYAAFSGEFSADPIGPWRTPARVFFFFIFKKKWPLSPVMLVRQRSIFTLADHLARHTTSPPGLLNPADPLAVRAGYMGMFWDGGMNPGAEELLALQSTLLVQHKGPNPSLWQNPERHIVMARR